MGKQSGPVLTCRAAESLACGDIEAFDRCVGSNDSDRGRHLLRLSRAKDGAAGTHVGTHGNAWERTGAGVNGVCRLDINQAIRPDVFFCFLAAWWRVVTPVCRTSCAVIRFRVPLESW